MEPSIDDLFLFGVPQSRGLVRHGLVVALLSQPRQHVAERKLGGGLGELLGVRRGGGTVSGASWTV